MQYWSGDVKIEMYENIWNMQERLSKYIQIFPMMAIVKSIEKFMPNTPFAKVINQVRGVRSWYRGHGSCFTWELPSRRSLESPSRGFLRSSSDSLLYAMISEII